MTSPNPLLRFPHLRDDLTRVEDELRLSVQADDPYLTDVASHLVLAGGKRVRPGLTIASAAASGVGVEPSSQEVIRGAVAVELVHLGSLYHDDVMDEAETRRNVPSVNAKWGNLKAILAGDFLLARASEIAASLGTEVAGLLASTIARLCEGQVRELQDVYNVDRTQDDYFTSIAGKTASLLATACRVGAIVTKLPRQQVDTLTNFGHRYGMAFQVVDDILDVVATDEELGKPSGNDLVEGTYTLPVLYALAGELGTDLRHILGQRLDETEREKARDLVRISGGVEQARSVAERYATDAARALEPVAGTRAADALSDATEHLLERVASAAT